MYLNTNMQLLTKHSWKPFFSFSSPSPRNDVMDDVIDEVIEDRELMPIKVDNCRPTNEDLLD